MIIFDSATPKYAMFDGGASPQTDHLFTYLGPLIGYPFWCSLDVFLPSLTQNFFVFSLADDGSNNRVALQCSGAKLNGNNFFVELAAQPGILTAGEWQRVMIYMEHRTKCVTVRNGAASAVDATDNAWLSSKRRLLVNARWDGGQGAPDLHANVAVANLAFGHAVLSDAELAANVLGVNPLSIKGCVVNYPFRTDSDDYFGNIPLTLVNAPAITLADLTYGDHPEVEVFPPAAGGARPIDFGGGLIT